MSATSQPIDGISELIEQIRTEHTNMGEPCEHCKHRFPYDDCVTCGQSWPCDPIVFASEVEKRFL